MYIWVFLCVSSPAFYIISMQYGTQWTETLISSILSFILYAVSPLNFILHKFAKFSYRFLLLLLLLLSRVN